MRAQGRCEIGIMGRDGSRCNVRCNFVGLLVLKRATRSTIISHPIVSQGRSCGYLEVFQASLKRSLLGKSMQLIGKRVTAVTLPKIAAAIM